MLVVRISKLAFPAESRELSRGALRRTLYVTVSTTTLYSDGRYCIEPDTSDLEDTRSVSFVYSLIFAFRRSAAVGLLSFLFIVLVSRTPLDTRNETRQMTIILPYPIKFYYRFF